MSVSSTSSRRFIWLIAAVLLGSIGSRSWGNGFAYHGISTQALLAGLRHPHPDDRAEAARSLGIRQEKAAVEQLLARLQDEQERDVVKHAVLDALGRIGDPRALQPIIEVLQHEGNGELRASAAQALGLFSDARARQALLDALQSEQKIVVQAAVVGALGHLQHEQAVNPLLALLRQTRQPELRREIARSLGTIGDPRAVKPLLAIMQQAPNDPGLESTAIVALGQIGDPLAIEPLLRAFDAEDLVTRLRVIEALGKIGHRNATQPLLNRLQQSLAETSSLATEPITQTFAEHMSLLHEQTAIVQALGRIQDPRAVDGLRQALAMRAFAQDSAEGLRLREGIYQRRRAAMVALSQLVAQQVVDALVGLLQDQDGQIRAEAARLLGAYGDVRSVEQLIAVLQDPQADVRLEATHALGQLGASQAVTALIGRLQDPHASVCEQAVLALTRLRDKRAIEPLQVLQQRNTDARVGLALLHALRQSQGWK